MLYESIACRNMPFPVDLHVGVSLGECPIKKGSVHVTFVTLQFYIFTEVKLNVKMVALSHTEDEK